MTEQITIEKNALGTVWVSRGGARVFGLPLSTSVERVGEVAEREGLPRETVEALWLGYSAGQAAAHAQARAAEEATALARVAETESWRAKSEAQAERVRTLRARRECAHRPEVSETHGYFGSSPGTSGDGRAAGGVTHIETCRCGARRYTDANGGHVDVGYWLTNV